MALGPSVAELAERIDSGLKRSVESALNRPITDGTLDDIRLNMKSEGLNIIDMSRERNYVDERVYSRVAYEKNFYKAVAAELARICTENGFDVGIPTTMMEAFPPSPPPIEPVRVETTDELSNLNPINGQDDSQLAVAKTPGLE